VFTGRLKPEVKEHGSKVFILGAVSALNSPIPINNTSICRLENNDNYTIDSEMDKTFEPGVFTL
jgi:hypothetical protein